MNIELEQKLVEKYPTILKNYRGDRKVTAMAWGFECGDGWYNLLDKGMEKIKYLCEIFSVVNSNKVEVVADQIKEKFGTLCFYYSIENATDIQHNIISSIIISMEDQSEHTCEVSGERGVLCKKYGWVKTLCDEEAEKLGYSPV